MRSTSPPRTAESRSSVSFDAGYDIISTQLPAVVTVVKLPYEPRYPTIKSKMAAKKKAIPVLTEAEIPAIDTTQCGLHGSPTRVKKTFTPVREKNGVKLEYPGGETPGNDVTVYTFNLVADKVDGSTADKAPLPGAVFELTMPDGTTVQLGTPVYKDAQGAPILDANGNLQYIVGKNEDGSDIIGGADQAMTQFTFPSLAEGEYVLTEIEAP